MLLAALACAAIAAPSSASSVSYQIVRSGSAKYHCVTADTRNGQVSVSTLFSSRLISAGRLIRKDPPMAAITGTFFDWRSQRPVAEVYREGQLMSRGKRGSVLAVDYYGKVHIKDVQYRKNFDWLSYKSGLRGAIRVVSSGRVQPNPKAQRFRDRRLWGRAARTAAGVTRDGRLVIVATANQVTLSELGRAMVKAKIVDGVAFDGGGSTCLYYRGKFVIGTPRPLNNMLAIYQRPVVADLRPPARPRAVTVPISN